MGKVIIIVRRIVMCLAGSLNGLAMTVLPISFQLHILRPCGCHHDGYITLDTFGAPRVSGGMCLGLYDLLIIGEMVRNRGYANGRQVVPASWIDDMIAVRDNRIWRAQNQTEGPRLFTDGNYRSLWYQTGFKDQEICAIGIHGQWLWINPQKELVDRKTCIT